MPVDKEIKDLFEVVDRRNRRVATVVAEMRKADPKGDPYAQAAAKIFSVPIENVSKKMRQEVKMFAFMSRHVLHVKP